jgi:hypothetical protein
MRKKTSKGWRMRITFRTDTTDVSENTPGGVNLDHSSVRAHTLSFTGCVGLFTLFLTKYA